MYKQPAPAKVRFKLLDGLRLLAAAAVIAYHYLGFQHSRWGMPVDEKFQFLSGVAAYGGLGVQLFFIISGFVILMSAWGRTIPQFVASRVSRLYPAYWVSVLASVLLLAVITRGTIKELSPGQVLVNLTMMQSGFGVPRVEGVYWTLWVELVFYVMVGFLISLNPTRGKITAFIVLWPIAAVVLHRTGPDFLNSILSPEYAPLFAGGMALYLVHAYGHTLVNWLLVLFNAALAAHQTSAGFFQKMIEDTGQDLSTAACVTIILLMFAVVALVTVSPLKGWGPGWLTYAGALTYPVYLMHENWGWWIISWANPVFGKWIALLLALAFTFGVAALIERLVERPVRPRLSKAVLRGLQQEERVKSRVRV
jgi:peptidoglycan/LPS O-acetylase OafA/YrhL